MKAIKLEWNLKRVEVSSVLEFFVEIWWKFSALSVSWESASIAVYDFKSEHNLCCTSYGLHYQTINKQKHRPPARKWELFEEKFLDFSSVLLNKQRFPGLSRNQLETEGKKFNQWNWLSICAQNCARVFLLADQNNINQS